MDDVVWPVLQVKVPPEGVATKVENPQLGVALMVGAAGVPLVNPVALPFGLGHPLAAVCLTVYVVAVVTLIEEVVAPVLHSNVPVADVERIDEPSQLLVTVTSGAGGTVFGAAVTKESGPVQPAVVL